MLFSYHTLHSAIRNPCLPAGAFEMANFFREETGSLYPPVANKQYRNRAGVLEKSCGGTFGSWLHAFLGKTGASPKVKSYVTLPFRKIRNCKGLEAPLPGFDIATSGSTFRKHTPKTPVARQSCMIFHWLSVGPAKY